MKIFADNRMLALGLIGGTCSRHTGYLRTANEQAPLYARLGVPTEKILHLNQTHSDKLLTISTDTDAQTTVQHPEQEADGWVFATQGWGGAILTADCVPLFLWDEQAKVFALAHCGWKGVVKELPLKTAQAMWQMGAKGKISGWLGPHIQSCCFEVQQDVADQFHPTSVLHKNSKLFVDLNTEIKHQLQTAGLNPDDIRTPYYCTCGDKENFFSWRRDHIRQNLLSFIYKP